MGSADKLFDGVLWHRDCAAIINSLEGSAWTTWTPTYGAGGSMTFTTVTTHYAKYRQVGKTVCFTIIAAGTTGGFAASNITFTLPVTAAATLGLAGGGFAVDGGGNLGASWYGASTTVASVAKYDFSAWGIGAGRTIAASGCYEAA